MHEPIVVVDPNEKKCDELCKLLWQHRLPGSALYSLTDLQEKIELSDCRVVILDLDTLPVDNRFFRNLKKQNPKMEFIGLSSRSFHPELQEAMSHYICSCLIKPVEDEELLFWVRSLLENIIETS